MPTDTTSPSLLRRVRDPADARAWREFDARYGDIIIRYCRRMGLQPFDAEDVRQMVMVRLSRVLPEFEYNPELGRFRGFLGRIVRNEAARLLNRPNAPASGVDEMAARPETGPDEAWEREWAHHHLRAALQQVRTTFDPRSVEVFERLLAGDTVEQTAALFGLSEQAVHKVKQRIRLRLRELVAARLRAEDDYHGPARPTSSDG